MTTANKFTIARLIMVIPFIAMMSAVAYLTKFSNQSLSFKNMNAATTIFAVSGALFAIAMITDFIDGYIARKTNTVTTFGKLFDPLADKFMTTSALISFAVLDIVPVWVVVIFVLRDVLVDGSRNIAAKNNLNVAANMWGKMKTVFQSIAIILLFILWPVCIKCQDQTSITFYTLNTVTFVALVLSVVSGVIYFKQIKHVIKLK
ncbi:CDP-diacylglycerol--glycerol-3-phosphate 3-phosphatidyltransferase [Mycoplasma todarodis]|uniref:CDP-diacylglycerol--glycerol-3-phosphate 3-phosphatidyltransferase n=1 Tax=Mycoplasma todarodis TaxID=1937191 RepID=A0A4R0XS18_9MOLU|nr:CDP-diacylglycerol--glycerol-3-phosphate 3-phosphatidyltransferase [Mycoplasma todarodis]TCG10477.1 CDP-diacylglycerol--glycerol-3-phosphate 3-phosphatidyltransferase [Mycoplasma todarodis]